MRQRRCWRFTRSRRHATDNLTRAGSASDIPGVKSERKLRDEFGETITDSSKEKEIEEMLVRAFV